MCEVVVSWLSLKQNFISFTTIFVVSLTHNDTMCAGVLKSIL